MIDMQAMEMQAAQGMAQSGYLQTPMNQLGSAILTLTNPENVLYKLELALRSLREEPDGTHKPIGPPLMNDHGINAMLCFFAPLVDRNSVLSNLDDEEVRLIFLDTAETLIVDLMLNRVKYEIKDNSTRNLLVNYLLNIYITLKRGYNQGEKHWLKGSVSEFKLTSQGQQPAKPGMLSSLANWRK